MACAYEVFRNTARIEHDGRCTDSSVKSVKSVKISVKIKHLPEAWLSVRIATGRYGNAVLSWLQIAAYIIVAVPRQGHRELRDLDAH